ncbi:hypothetical protein QTG54_000809 [Skeletonema marinoi]|uniref:Uncharacterized protein n=1 Tax=Skeletonema marinoi TaxID=267567 RepID=A0AAD8YNW5_9STRA|nr:hypothetical protein QTG54_000809 [Skeletonema marinoi]
MLILDAPQKNTKYPNGSMFGCPVDAFKDKKEFDQFTGNNHKHLEMKEDFPMGCLDYYSIQHCFLEDVHAGMFVVHI